MDVTVLAYMRGYLRQEINNDIPFVNWLLKLDNFHLLEIKEDRKKIELTDKNVDIIKLIEFIINQRKEGKLWVQEF